MARLKPSIPDMQVAFSESVCLHPNEFNIGSLLMFRVMATTGVVVTKMVLLKDKA